MSTPHRQVAQRFIDKLQLTKERYDALDESKELDVWFGLIGEEVKLLPQAVFVELALTADATLSDNLSNWKTGETVMLEMVSANVSSEIDDILHLNDARPRD